MSTLPSSQQSGEPWFTYGQSQSEPESWTIVDILVVVVGCFLLLLSITGHFGKS